MVIHSSLLAVFSLPRRRHNALQERLEVASNQIQTFYSHGKPQQANNCSAGACNNTGSTGSSTRPEQGFTAASTGAAGATLKHRLAFFRGRGSGAGGSTSSSSGASSSLLPRHCLELRSDSSPGGSSHGVSGASTQQQHQQLRGRNDNWGSSHNRRGGGGDTSSGDTSSQNRSTSGGLHRYSRQPLRGDQLRQLAAMQASAALMLLGTSRERHHQGSKM